MKCSFGFYAATLATVVCTPVLTGDDDAGLEVSRVAVFSSGVAYFERGATVSGNARADLKFRTDQINDILKSLVVQDLDGGTIGAVSYASRDPIEKTLKSFGVDLTGRPTLAKLLDQLRGEPVEIGGPRAIRGIILGVEKQKVQVDDGLIEYDMLNILTDSGVEQLRLSELQGIKLSDKKVDGELRKALAALARAHDADKKSVVLHFNGQRERRVKVSYLLEAPIWKTSYRLVLSDDGKAFLQGWAMVENATEEDWTDVRLSLISGRPISFRMDLYTPLYVTRPVEKLELYASLRAPEYEGAFEQKDKAAQRAAAIGSEARRGRRRGKPESPTMFEGDFARRGQKLAAPAGRAIALTGGGVASVATAQEAGELFEYVIDAPVSIARQHSAMLPIVNEEIEGHKVSIFNPATHAKYPLNGLEFTNTTKLHLMQGPVTVFDANVYAGDAKLPDLKPGEKRLIAYALDLATEVMTKQKSHPDRIVSMRIAKGTLWHKRKYVDERTYVVKNKADKERVILIEQPYTHDWKLLEPKEPYEQTPQLLRFKVSVPPRETVSQKVLLERVLDQSVALSDVAPSDIRIYLRNPVISPAVKQALEKVVELRVELDRVIRAREELDKQVNEDLQDVVRVRRNVGAIPRNTDFYKRQLKKFEILETRIEEGREKVRAAREDEEDKRAALEKYLLSLSVE